jgi:hypothetical protein
MDVSLDVQVSAGFSRLSLFWNNLTDTAYTVMCIGVVSNDEPEVTFSSSHFISLAVHNSTSAVFDKLISGVSYNCCVSTNNLTHHDCVASTVDIGGLSTPVVGVIGGIIGALIVLLSVLIIGGAIVAWMR